MSAPLESVIQIEGGVKSRKAKSKSSSAAANPVSHNGDVKNGTDGVAR